MKLKPKPEPYKFRKQMVTDDFEIFAFAAIDAVGMIEGWQDNRPAAVIGSTDNHWTPTRKFLAEFRRNLKSYNFHVLSRSEEM